MDPIEARRLAVDNLRTRLELLENERRMLLRELASPGLPKPRRAEALARRAELQQAHDQATKALRSLGEAVDEI